MIKATRNIVLIALLTGITHSCYYDNAEDLYGYIPPAVYDGEVGFKADIQPIISQSCAISGCHVGGGRAPLSNYSEVKSAIVNQNLSNRVLDRIMPPANADALSDIDFLKFKKWLEEGAQDN